MARNQLRFEVLSVELDNPLCIIPGHTIKENRSPHIPVAIVHRGGGSDGGRIHRRYAVLLSKSVQMHRILTELVQESNERYRKVSNYNAIAKKARRILRAIKAQD